MGAANSRHDLTVVVVKSIAAQAMQSADRIWTGTVRLAVLGDRGQVVLDGVDSSRPMAGGRRSGPDPEREANHHGKRALSESDYDSHRPCLPAPPNARNRFIDLAAPRKGLPRLLDTAPLPRMTSGHEHAVGLRFLNR